MKIFKFLFVCTILFSCSKPKVGEIGNYQVALGKLGDSHQKFKLNRDAHFYLK